MTRLRRSLRGGAPTKLTLEERFEKIISYVKDGNYSEHLREFNMPSHILLSFRADGSTTPKTQLEALPTDILLKIVDNLTGNEQIMATLVCKTFATVVETSDIRKIGNITHFVISKTDPAFRSPERTANWHENGFQQPFPRTTFSASYLENSPIWRQWQSLKGLVGDWLGPRYKYCDICRKFRPAGEKFWRDFAEYENPGITKKVVNDEPAKKKRKTVRKPKKPKKPIRGNEAAEKVETCLLNWQKAGGNTGSVDCCPAHDLLKERDGERLIKKVEYEV